jgi:MtN3 and saliva related transmembrane protein
MVSSSVRDFFGIFGGILFSICTIPQLVLMWKQRSAKDLSYGWMCTFLLGLSSTITYLVLQEAYAAYIPAAVEAVLYIAIIISKIILDREHKQKELSSDDNAEQVEC